MLPILFFSPLEKWFDQKRTKYFWLNLETNCVSYLLQHSPWERKALRDTGAAAQGEKQFPAAADF